MDEYPEPQAHLDVTAVHVHAADHAALCGHVRPVDHLFRIVIIQSYSIVQALLHRITHLNYTC